MSEEKFQPGTDLTDYSDYTDHTDYTGHKEYTDYEDHSDRAESDHFFEADAVVNNTVSEDSVTADYSYGSTSGNNTCTGTYSTPRSSSNADTYGTSGSSSYTGAYDTSGSSSNAGAYDTAGSSSDAGAYDTAGSSLNAGTYGTSGTGFYGSSRSSSYSNVEKSSGSDSARSGRYYSYSRPEVGGGTPVPPSRGGNRNKGRGRLIVALAVILVFLLGAGAGAMFSGRSATATLSDSRSSSSQSRGEGSVDTEEKKTENKGEKGQTGTVSGTGSGGNTITRVEDSEGGGSIADTSVADVAERVMPAIVSVYNKYTEESRFFGRTYTQEAESTGSGIIIEETDSELLIVTNNHVVEGADSLSVQFINEENCEAALKGTDVSSDLAVIAVSLDSLSNETKEQIAIAELGDSDTLRIGEHAIAIGNALGYGQSLTVGYISALNREITSENGITGTFIQTDAAINPGNSGGALLNSKGQVIGINSNKIGGSSVEGMGFAIPISKAIPIIESLKSQESKTKVAEEDQGILGIYGITVTSDVASAYGLPVGAYVEEIIEGGGAEKSDLQEGDIITAINGQTVTGMEDIQNQLSYYSAGEEVTLTVQHPIEGGKYEEREIKVTLSKRSEVSSSSEGSENQRGQNDDSWSSEGENRGLFSFPFGF